MNSSEENDTPEAQSQGAAEQAEGMQQEGQEAVFQGAASDDAREEADETQAEVTGGLDPSQLQEELAAAQAKADENWERSLRLQADMDNQRRRFEKQVEDAHKFSVQRFAEGLLPVIDSLEMGMQADGSVEKIREGMDLTLKQFNSVMEKFNLEPVGEVGDQFNPELHQAVGMQPSPEHEDNTVLTVMQKGYTLSGRTIRPAMVMVCKN